jgi:hypothetical protein
MNASWPMVIAALTAGTLGGFLIPMRAEIRDVPSISRAKEPAEKTVSAATPVKAGETAEIRKIGLTEPTAPNAQLAEEKTTSTQAEEIPCERQAWPNQTPNCLDRSAKVAPAKTVPARRIDPAVTVADKPEPQPEAKAVESKSETTSVAAPAPAAPAAAAVVTPKAEPVAAPKAEPAVKPLPKVVSAPPAREERAAPPQPEQAAVQPAREERSPRPQQTATRSNEPRAETAAQEDDRRAERPRRSTRRVTPDDLDDAIPTRIYLRGPDGRLYLAPEYRPSGRTVYYVR